MEFRKPRPIKGWWSPDPDFQVKWASHHYPNRFHRWMQKVCLGIYWERNK